MALSTQLPMFFYDLFVGSSAPGMGGCNRSVEGCMTHWQTTKAKASKLFSIGHHSIWLIKNVFSQEYQWVNVFRLLWLHSPVHNLMVVEELKSKNHTSCIKPEVKKQTLHLLTCTNREWKVNAIMRIKETQTSRNRLLYVAKQLFASCWAEVFVL